MEEEEGLEVGAGAQQVGRCHENYFHSLARMILAIVTSNITLQGGCKRVAVEGEEFGGGGVHRGAMWGNSEGRSCIQKRHTCRGTVGEGN